MDGLKVLFVGNSYTYCNKMPQIVSKLAASADVPKTLEVEMVTQGGVSLEWHFSNPETLAAIREKAWDIVVLQDQSLGPVEHRKRMFQYGSALNDEIQKCGAQTVFYMTWARQHIPEMQDDLTEAYTSLARKINAKVAPVGIAWKNSLKTEPDLTLHTEDKSHPNPAGSYLAACVFYATFYAASPVGLTGSIMIDREKIIDLNDNDARFLQSIAWETVRIFEL